MSLPDCISMSLPDQKKMISGQSGRGNLVLGEKRQLSIGLMIYIVPSLSTTALVAFVKINNTNKLHKTNFSWNNTIIHWFIDI